MRTESPLPCPDTDVDAGRSRPSTGGPPRRGGACQFIVGAVAAWALLLATTGAVADTLRGQVVGISDGDTITVLDDTKKQHKIRLSGIDAPEKGQPFGDRSKQSLAGMVFRKQVVVGWHKYDRYRRVIGKVLLDGRDVNFAQVSAGLAWHYKDYQREQSPADRRAYAEAEHKARVAHVGLWRDPSPIAPWDFRRRNR